MDPKVGYDYSTHLNIYHTSFKWLIKDCSLTFHHLKKNKVESSEFALTYTDYKCGITLGIDKLGNMLDVSVKVPSEHTFLKMKITLSYIDRHGKLSQTKVIDKSSAIAATTFKCDVNLVQIFKDCKSDNLINDSLTLLCEIEDVQEFCNSEVERTATYDNRRTNDILESFRMFYERNQFCDVTFIVVDERFHAHTLVLSAQSPVFIAIFNDRKKQQEADCKELTIDLSSDEDITADVFRAFLRFVYDYKEIQCTPEITFDLLVVADKYDVNDLVDTCERQLCTMVTLKNIVYTLLFANKYRCKKLKKEALLFAKSNMSEIKSTPEFSDLCKDAGLMSDLI